MALYLKYRPQDFSSLVGQKFIKETLKTAVSQDKTVGAYLFTGGRGTGKTSTARIFAKAINCEKPKNGDPCGKCGICTSFAENSLIDIIEIDAASHTGVDNIREIIEKAQFQPTRTKYKIYIIDEVHMLSKGAFNALLKILEEPPEHIKFILATTEIHKIPETILSRCQRYDFRNFSPEDISSQILYIAEKEKVKIDDESLEYIVKMAEGGMRNAISLFEQLIVNSEISFSHIVDTLGLASEDEKQQFLEKLLQKDSSLLNDFEEVKSKGKNVKNFLKDINKTLGEKAIEKAKKGENITREIELLEVLQDTLMKTKNSFDESMTIQIGLLKIVAGVQIVNPTPAATPSILRTSPSTKETKKVPPHRERENYGEKEGGAIIKDFGAKITPKENIIEQAQDIFSSSISDEKKLESGTKISGFDTKAFISAMKTQGSKAAANMSILGSDVRLEGEVLYIQTKTKISLVTLQKAESQECMFAAGKKMGMKLSKIELS